MIRNVFFSSFFLGGEGRGGGGGGVQPEYHYGFVLPLPPKRPPQFAPETACAVALKNKLGWV